MYIIGRTTEAITLRSGRLVFPFELETAIKFRSKHISEVGVYYSDNILKAIIIPTADMIEDFGSDDNFMYIHNYMR